MNGTEMDPDIGRLRATVEHVRLGPEAETLGRVVRIGDGLAEVSGLSEARFGELLLFEDGRYGLVLNLEPETLQVVLLDPSGDTEAGSAVHRTGEMVSVPVGDGLLGRIVDPLGRPLDDEGPIEAAPRAPVEQPAPAIIDRDFVSQPLQTGVMAVDALFAIGRGQRELIIGERATGKTALAVDTILNQRETGVVCVYVAIGQPASAVRRVIEAIRERGAIERSVFVVAEATAEPGLRWLAPFAGTTIAEQVRDRGGDALIIYDDLTRHAATHRELALLARQPPGREAYPADVFYLHARLLERAAKLSAERGGGSLTALPIAEIEAGNLAGYIPTNLISIADGQIVLSSRLFAANQRPAIDVGLSVSRVGGKAQPRLLKRLAGRVRLDYAQYLELRMFSRFGGFGDESLKRRITHGERIGALLSQPRFSPLRPVDQIALLVALADGMLDAAPVEAVAEMKSRLPAAIDGTPALAGFDADAEELTDEMHRALLDCVSQALEQWDGAGETG